MGHRWDVMGRHIAVKGTTGMLTGAALGAVGAGAGAIPGAGIGAAMGMFRGALSGAAQIAHEEFLTKMAHNRVAHIKKTGRVPGSVHPGGNVLHRAAQAVHKELPKTASAEHHSKTVHAVNTLANGGNPRSVSQALQHRKAHANTMANAVKNAQFEAKHRRVHGKFA